MDLERKHQDPITVQSGRHTWPESKDCITFTAIPGEPQDQHDTDGEPLGASSVTLVGNVLPVSNNELAEVGELYLERHANSKHWVDLKTFRSTA